MNGKRTQFSIEAGSSDASARVGVEYGAVMGTDEAVVVIGEKTIRREIERSALVGTEIDPRSRLPLAARRDQPQRLAVMIDPEFPIAPLDEFMIGAQEH